MDLAIELVRTICGRLGLLFVIVVCSIKLTASAEEGFVRSYAEERLPALGNLCRAGTGVFVPDGMPEALCVSGAITSYADGWACEPPIHAENRRQVKIVYADTPGGEFCSFIKLAAEMMSGRSLATKPILIVGGACHSACANYLVPAASAVYMADGAVISQHGTLPRDLASYLDMKIPPTEKSRMIQIGALGDLHARYAAATRDYAAFVDEEIALEDEVFRMSGVDSLYARRYHDVAHAVRERDPVPGARGMTLVLGPGHMARYGVRLVRPWFAGSPADYVRILPKTADRDVLVWDLDEAPFSYPAQ